MSEKFQQDLNVEASKVFVSIEAQKVQLQNGIKDLEARQSAIMIGAGIPSQGNFIWTQIEDGIIRISERPDAPKLGAVEQSVAAL
jgi:hypothetical protein